MGTDWGIASKVVNLKRVFDDAVRQQQWKMEHEAMQQKSGAYQSFYNSGINQGTMDVPGAVQGYNQSMGIESPSAPAAMAQGQDPMVSSSSSMGATLPNGEKKLLGKAGASQQEKYSSSQDKLEQNAISKLSSIRGDTSIARIETQRDASISAYNTIDSIKKEGRLPSQIEYYDIIGQLWKARTGAAPTNEAIRDLDAKTWKGSLGKAATYVTGKPMGTTTAEVLDNIQNFAKVSGNQADKLHAGYMQTHLIKPAGLDEERWNNIKKNNRGLSFDEAIQSNNNTSSDSGSGTTKSGNTFKRIP